MARALLKTFGAEGGIELVDLAKRFDEEVGEKDFCGFKIKGAAFCAEGSLGFTQVTAKNTGECAGQNEHKN